MVNVQEAVIARLKKQGKDFEILVDCDKALEFKKGENVSLDEVLATNDIFKDVKKGLHASNNEIKELFNTTNNEEVAKIIIKDGEIQLTAEHKNKIREEKRKKIINIIHRNAINPQTNLPHPPQRIESAIEEAKVNIDEYKRAEDQVQEIVKKINPILPIKFELRKFEIIVPPKFAGQSFGILKNLGKIQKDEWLNDGSLLAVIEIPAGLQEELENEINKLTHGDIQIKLMEK